MNELYWITRFDAIDKASMFFAIFSAIAVFVSLVIYFMSDPYYEGKCILKTVKKVFKIFAPIFFISCLLQIFVPTTKEAFAICGIGGTIDYLKSNEKGTQLPDKCIDALDKFISEYSGDDKSNRKE